MYTSTVVMMSRPTVDAPFKPVYVSGLRTNIEAVTHYMDANEVLGWEKFRVLDESL